MCWNLMQKTDQPLEGSKYIWNRTIQAVHIMNHQRMGKYGCLWCYPTNLDGPSKLSHIWLTSNSASLHLANNPIQCSSPLYNTRAHFTEHKSSRG